MAWWGKLLGGAFGFMLGGPLGALLGASLGHGVDRGIRIAEEADELDPGERERVQTAFFTAAFSVLGRVAKADGRVSEAEIGLARKLMEEMDLTPDMRRTAVHLFNQGKAPDFPLEDVLEQFRRECHRRQSLLRIFLEIQLQGAYADGMLEPAEAQLLPYIARRLGFSDLAYRALERMIRAEWEFTGGGARRRAAETAPRLGDAYALLNVGENAADAEVKKAYRRLINQHHPDKLVSKGLPEEMMKLATQKTHEIKQAYEAIRQSRGMR